MRTFCVAQESQTKEGRINSDNNLLTEFLLPGGGPFADDTIDKNLSALRQVTPTDLLKRSAHTADAAEALFQQAESDIREGKLREALQTATRAAGGSPTCAKCQKLQGIILLRLKQFEPAASAFKRSLMLDPNQFGARLMLGETLLATGNEEQGLKELVAASAREDGSF